MSTPFRLHHAPRPFLEGLAAVQPKLEPVAFEGRVRRRLAPLTRAQRLALYKECLAVLALETTRGEPLDAACEAVRDELRRGFHADVSETIAQAA